jgi:hypothetical protein
MVTKEGFRYVLRVDPISPVPSDEDQQVILGQIDVPSESVVSP